MEHSELRSDLNGIVFSSGTNYDVAEALAENLSRYFPTIPYRSFFDRDNETILTTFLRKLLVIDVAVLILGADDIQKVPDNDGNNNEIYVPRDNVVFELGATMARLGTKKVFMVVPGDREVRVLSYLREMTLPGYSRKDGQTWSEAVEPITGEIVQKLGTLGEDLFHSDLPALGLVQSYFYNFVKPVFVTLDEGQTVDFEESESHHWSPESGFTLSIVIPDQLMNRTAVDEFCKEKLGTENVFVKLRDGRDISVYALPRKNEDAPLHMLDIPTTLLTSSEVIARVDDFWRTQDEERTNEPDEEFRSALAMREIATFRRRMNAILIENHLGLAADGNQMHVVDLSDVESHIKSLI